MKRKVVIFRFGLFKGAMAIVLSLFVADGLPDNELLSSAIVLECEEITHNNPTKKENVGMEIRDPRHSQSSNQNMRIRHS